jgi:hypothetical protein
MKQKKINFPTELVNPELIARKLKVNSIRFQTYIQASEFNYCFLFFSRCSKFNNSFSVCSTNSAMLTCTQTKREKKIFFFSLHLFLSLRKYFCVLFVFVKSIKVKNFNMLRIRKIFLN